MARVLNWDVRLVEFAREVRGQPYVWGETDCATLVRRALTVMHGEDPLPDDVGAWTTRIGALRVAGRTDVEDALYRAGGWEVRPPYATAGDVALAQPHGQGDPLPTLSVLLPRGKVLTSTPQLGVAVLARDSLDPGTRYFRHE